MANLNNDNTFGVTTEQLRNSSSCSSSSVSSLSGTHREQDLPKSLQTEGFDRGGRKRSKASRNIGELYHDYASCSDDDSDSKEPMILIDLNHLLAAGEAAGASAQESEAGKKSEANRLPLRLVVSKSFTFPMVLHSLLSQAQEHNYDLIISWKYHGRAFEVHDPQGFVNDIMPHFFHQTKYTSFLRQLAMYGFQKIKNHNNPDFGAFYHEMFLRGKPNLCRKMHRTRSKSSVKLGVSATPNFSTMSIVGLSHKKQRVEQHQQIVNCISSPLEHQEISSTSETQIDFPQQSYDAGIQQEVSNSSQFNVKNTLFSNDNRTASLSQCIRSKQDLIPISQPSHMPDHLFSFHPDHIEQQRRSSSQIYHNQSNALVSKSDNFGSCIQYLPMNQSLLPILQSYSLPINSSVQDHGASNVSSNIGNKKTISQTAFNSLSSSFQQSSNNYNEATTSSQAQKSIDSAKALQLFREQETCNMSQQTSKTQDYTFAQTEDLFSNEQLDDDYVNLESLRWDVELEGSLDYNNMSPPEATASKNSHKLNHTMLPTSNMGNNEIKTGQLLEQHFRKQVRGKVLGYNEVVSVQLMGQQGHVQNMFGQACSQNNNDSRQLQHLQAAHSSQPEHLPQQNVVNNHALQLSQLIHPNWPLLSEEQDRQLTVRNDLQLMLQGVRQRQEELRNHDEE